VEEDIFRSDGTLPIMCYSIGEGLDHMANRMLEIPYKTPYKQLQDIINNKYNIPVQI
jgi:hypothetical protein